ncbi:rhodanese-like domain-containing protein [Bdellovibrio sp. KM01]|uniref:rhodanese-like domain-containing protein n=1 Tax=Bdellovibrio sp. KM01 TaxID=2748865 RepID=UPI0015E91ABB|nr:rhodanese-like domain-containing protein [Bdellovibrio sp. KM01]QLY26399.1 rhodanese-like domain-containing protein [Bdellovibrio sp. KM01]
MSGKNIFVGKFVPGVAVSIILASHLAFAKDVFLDVRTAEEFSQGHIPNAINIDVLKTDFSSKVSELNRNDVYKVYCKRGSRAKKAVTIMHDLNFKNLDNLGSYEDAQVYFKKSQDAADTP